VETADLCFGFASVGNSEFQLAIGEVSRRKPRARSVCWHGARSFPSFEGCCLDGLATRTVTLGQQSGDGNQFELFREAAEVGPELLPGVFL
jgi:hypothetical protein